MYRSETNLLKIKVHRHFALDSRMNFERGEGGKEIENHGWSRVKSFSQETVAIGQRTSRNDEHEPKLYIHRKMNNSESSAGCTRFSDSTPLFFSPGTSPGRVAIDKDFF